MYNTTVIEETDKYQILGQREQGLLFLHCTVYQETLSCLKEIKKKFPIILEEAFKAGYDEVFSQTNNIRFIEFLGIPYENLENDSPSELVVWVSK